MNCKIKLEASENGISRDKLLEFLNVLEHQIADLPNNAVCEFGMNVEVEQKVS